MRLPTPAIEDAPAGHPGPEMTKVKKTVFPDWMTVTTGEEDDDEDEDDVGQQHEDGQVTAREYFPSHGPEDGDVDDPLPADDAPDDDVPYSEEEEANGVNVNTRTRTRGRTRGRKRILNVVGEEK